MAGDLRLKGCAIHNSRYQPSVDNYLKLIQSALRYLSDIDNCWRHRFNNSVPKRLGYRIRYHQTMNSNLRKFEIPNRTVRTNPKTLRVMDLEKLAINFKIQNLDEYETEFKENNIILSKTEIDYCIKYANKLIKKNYPIIFNMNHLSFLTKFTKKHINFFIRNSDTLYTDMKIRKKTTGFRKISAPRKDLKNLQKWILNEILNNASVHKSSKGFLKDMSIVDNAKIHVNNEILINIDLKDFFPSIKYNRIFSLFRGFGYSDSVSRTLTKICVYKNALPQGSPASPMISNLICRKLDARLFGYCQKYGFNYSRYADDISISGEKKLVKYKDFIFKIIQKEGFEINFNKLRVTGKSNAQIVTGLNVNEDEVSYNRRKIRQIRAIIHNCQTKGPLEANINNNPYFKQFIYGNVAFLKTIKPDLYQNWKNILDNLDWSEYNKKYNLEIREKTLRNLYKKILGRYNLDFRRIPIFSEIPTFDTITESEREQYFERLQNLKEKCNIEIASVDNKCKTCLVKIYDKEVHNCIKRIIGYFTGQTGGAHHGGEIGDGWTPYQLILRNNIYGDDSKNIVFVAKSGKLDRSQKDTLIRQCQELINDDTVKAVILISPSEIELREIRLILQHVKIHQKKFGIINPPDLICILKKYYEENSITI